MASNRNPLTWNLKQYGFIHVHKQNKTHWHKQRISNLAEFWKVSRRLAGSLFRRFQFPAVPEGPGRFPEGFTEEFFASVDCLTFKTCCNLDHKLTS